MLSRRQLLVGAAGLAGATGLSALLAACGDDSSGSASGTVTFGSNYSDAKPKAAMQAALDSFQSGGKVKVKVNTVDHNSFQENITTYLQGTPDDVFTWFAGYRMQFFAAKGGLIGDISDVWKTIGGDMSPALKQASTGADGKQYFVPFYYYPWAVFYRKSVFAAKGYQVPKTLDDFKKLGDQMKKDGLVPMAFGDKDGWPAMGTFDYLNLRQNGYQFHVDLMANRKSWDSKEVKDVFKLWKDLLPYHQDGSLGRTWQDAAKSVADKQAGMYLLGAFVGQQFTGDAYDDLDFFPFPEINPDHGQDTVEAPIDGFMMAAKPKNSKGAQSLLQFLATAPAQQSYLGADPNDIAASSKADSAKYNALQKKSIELIGGAKNISQFLDRDTRPDFASNVMIPAIQSFIKSPDDIDGLTSGIASKAKDIFAA
jgi:multiple sugar transport system substrate-binding protein